jgi:hypothetical protein
MRVLFQRASPITVGQPGATVRTTRTFILSGALLTAMACGRGGDIVDPGDGGPTVLDGIALSAQVVEVIHDATSVTQLTMRVTLTNTTNQVLVRNYPAGCPVLMRFYHPLDFSLAYDEGQRPCTVTTPVEFRLEPQESMTLTSGLRFPWEILGDSLGSGAYYAAALLRITGSNPIEIDAGTTSIPHCEQVGISTICN